METKTKATHQAVADTLGLSISGVSRLRSGERTPSLSLMQRIETKYGFAVQDQSDALKVGLSTWVDKFETAINPN